ncbi:hypothetical protein BTS2_1659 [Bacillus sp. TS-2]|nr:hypothetical protein BTS2_1659 [Bacillus sp. TS-2]
MTNEKGNHEKRVLIMVSVEAEREIIKQAIEDIPYIDIEVMGVGPANAAANTTKKLIKSKYDLVINAGIAGGFQGRADIGSIVIATEIQAADLGSESPEGFLKLEELGLGQSKIMSEVEIAKKWAAHLEKHSLPVHIGPILTLNTVTGTEATTYELSERLPEAKAEAMEGFGVATAAKLFNVPVIEIRAISNIIGPRNKDAWKIKEALNQLKNAFAVIEEVLS